MVGWPCTCPDEDNHKGCPYRVRYELTSCTVSKIEVTQRFTEKSQDRFYNSVYLCVFSVNLCVLLFGSGLSRLGSPREILRITD